MSYLFQNATAFDPYSGEGVPNASGQVFAMSDTAFTTPLTVTLLSSGLQTTELVSDQYSQLPGFDAGDNVQVRFKSGEFVKILNTSTPLVGPQGDTGKSAYEVAVEGGYTGTEAEYNASLTDAPNLVTRAETAETAAVNAASLVEAPADEVVATLVQGGTLTNAALSAAIVNEAMPVSNVAKYGGLGDYSASTGGTDNYPAIMAAIAATPPGGTVYLPGILQSNGTGARYYCSQTIVIDKPIKLVGPGTHSTGITPASSLVFPAGVDGIHIVNSASGGTASQWWLEGLFLESLSTSADGSVGILATSGTGRMDSVSVNNFGGHGIHLLAGSGVGGGNINNSIFIRVRAYGCWGDGIRVEGTDAQSLLFLKSDVVANRGWGIHQVSGGATNQYIGAHFDQSYHGSPGAFRDNTMSTAWINVYVENGGENGGTIELGPNANYGYISFSTYAGISKIVDNSLGATMWIDDRRAGAKRENSGLISKDGEHLYKTRVGAGADSSIRLIYGGGSSALTSKEIYGYNRSADIFTFNTEVGPSSTAGEVDLGRAAYPWRNGHFSGYVKVGAFTTASRPSPSLSGAGAHIFDTTLGMPLWSNGTVWRDATGTAV